MNWCFSVHCTEEARPGLSRKPQLHKGATRCCTQVHPQPGEYSRGQDPGWFYQYVLLLWNFTGRRDWRRGWYPIAAAAKSLQSCPTLCDPIDGSPPGRLPRPWDSPGKNTGVVAISFSNAWKWKVKVKSLSRVQLSETPWTAAHQAPLSMGVSRKEYWSGVPLPSPGILWIGDKSMVLGSINTRGP